MILKKKLLGLLFLFPLVLSSCISKYINNKSKGYNETFYYYYISPQKNDLVFTGEKYNYVFKDDGGYIAKLTKKKWKKNFAISSINLSVNKSNFVTGSITIQTLKPIASLIKNKATVLKKYGFQENINGFLSIKIKLNGIRYLPRKNSKKPYKNNLSIPYKTKIKYNLSKGEKLRKALITPIAYTADGAIIIIGGVYIPLIIFSVYDMLDDKK